MKNMGYQLNTGISGWAVCDTILGVVSTKTLRPQITYKYNGPKLLKRYRVILLIYSTWFKPRVEVFPTLRNVFVVMVRWIGLPSPIAIFSSTENTWSKHVRGRLSCGFTPRCYPKLLIETKYWTSLCYEYKVVVVLVDCLRHIRRPIYTFIAECSSM